MKTVRSIAFGALVIVLLAMNHAHSASYSVKDLGPGSATGINDSGLAVGVNDHWAPWYFDGNATQLLPPILIADWSPSPDSPPELHDLYYAKTASNMRILNSGRIAGIVDYWLAGSIPWPFIYTYVPGGSNVCRFLNQGFSEGASGSGRFAINESGAMVFSYQAQNFPNLPDAGIWLTNGLFVHPGAGFFRTGGINSHGVTAGSSGNPLPPQACIVTNGVLVNIDPRPPGDIILGPFGILYTEHHWSDANSINDLGHVVGDMSLGTPSATKHAFIFQGSGLEDLGTLGGVSSTALNIDNSDRVVGFYVKADGSTRAFLWQQGTATDLNTLLPENSGWVLLKANAVNIRGQIVGDGLYQGLPHAFMLSPANGVRVALTRVNDGSYTLTVTGESDNQYRLDFADSLSSTAPWAPLTTLTLSGPSGSYTDSTTNAVAARYYRAVQVP